jgi:mannose-1-phosphate guanylyltransferase
MQEIQSERHCQEVILAGGGGNRVKPLTHLRSDNDRRDQFCPLLDGETLLAQTQFKIAGSAEIHYYPV